MTLSLDDVRNKRFRMARKSGYEVLEVDEFVDEIEESFAQLLEENENLKKQVESLRAAEDGTREMPSAPPRPLTPPSEPAAAKPAAPEPAKTPTETVVVTTAKEASTAVVRLVQLSTEQAEQLVSEATQEAIRIREEANQTAQQVTGDAKTRAEQVESEARAKAERLQAQTLSRSEQLSRDIDKRRAEMLTQLQTQREELSSSVRELRAFEAVYRSNLTEHLRSQISVVQSGRAEPSPVPELSPPTSKSSSSAGDGSPTGDGAAGDGAKTDDTASTRTPQLDALLGDQR